MAWSRDRAWEGGGTRSLGGVVMATWVRRMRIGRLGRMVHVRTTGGTESSGAGRKGLDLGAGEHA